jgi:predicted TIM-barrel fold metal-dependent hydrolase
MPLNAGAQQRLPVIDMHLHALAADANGPPPVAVCVPFLPHLPPRDPSKTWEEIMAVFGKNPPCPNPIWSPATDEALIEQTIAVLERLNIIGVLSGTPERVRRWRKAAPGRFIPALRFQIGAEAPAVDTRAGIAGPVSPELLRRLYEGGHIAILGEVLNQYVGIAPGDPRFEPYLAVAEELDIPVGIHMGGVPGAPYLGLSGYRARLTSPFLLEDVLIRHPRLRVYVMHYGSPLVDEMIAVLQTHPQVYVDIGGNQWLYPRVYFYRQLERLIDAGFGKRVMFGSDQVTWPGVIEPAIAIIEQAPFLSQEQKRDILYNNAARFLRLSKEEIAKHHSWGKPDNH